MPVKRIIALADDNEVSSEALAVNLKDDYEVHVFDSGYAALDSMACQHFDLLLLDVAMPGMNGYETCRRLRSGQAQPDLPVIFVSAHARLEDLLRGYDAGGDDYLIKPCNIEELRAKALHAIDHHRRARRLAGEVDELGQSVMLTAEMLGEVGVVLEFQRTMTACTTADALARAMISTLSRFGLEGSIRLVTRHTAIDRSPVGRTTELEATLLDQLAARSSVRITTMGTNLGFSFGSVTMLVRSLRWAAAAHAPETVDAMGRARDNLALMVEGAVVRLRAIEAENDASQLAGANSLLAMTHVALQDIQKMERELHRELDGVFNAMRDEFEMRFPQLGLTASQEDSLADVLTRYRARALAVFERGRAVEARMHRLVEQLEEAPHSMTGTEPG